MKIETDQIENELDHLELSNSLPLFVNQYFSKLKNRVDIACQTYLMQQDTESSESSEQALRNQYQLISEIEIFEETCLSHIKEHKLDQSLSDLIIINSKEVFKNNRSIDSSLLDVQKEVFLNKTLIFLDENSSLVENGKLRLPSFGCLVLVEDEFIGEINEIKSQSEPMKLTNQMLKEDFLQMSICRKILNLEAINRINLQLNKVDVCDMRLRRLNQIDRNAFKNLRNLVNIDLSQNDLPIIEPGTFNRLESLRVINLSHNLLDRLNIGTFNGLSNLKTLYLVNNKIVKLDPFVFKDLENIEVIEIYQNFLNEIDYRLFQGLIKLEHIGLGQNQLATLDSRLFQGLKNLKILNLNNNHLSMLNPNIFQGLVELKNIDLGNNQLRLLDPGIFRGLESLELVSIGDNKLIMVDTSIFRGLNKLTSVYIEGNHLNSDTVFRINNRCF